jgi:2-methylcitrate dehydratase PrpD
VKGHLRYGSFTQSALHDPTIAALRHRVHLSEDPQMSAAVPPLKPARVTVTLKDGRQAMSTCDHDRRSGEPQDESEIRAKFRELAELVLTSEGVEAAQRAIDGCENWTSIDPLTTALRRYGRRRDE